MRVRPFALFVVLLLPASVNAQRIHVRLPWIGPRPPRAEPLPPQAPAIARALRYQASRFSTESYAVLNLVETDRNVNSGPPVSSTLGFGQRMDWRVKPAFSITGDVAASLYGGPFTQTSFDLGGRYRPVRGYEYRLRPYFDLRASWLWAFPRFAQPTEPTIAIASPNILGRASGSGIGALGGAGFETVLTPNLSLNSGLSLARYRMSAWQAYGATGLQPYRHFGTTAVRFTLGLTFNPGHMVPIP